MEELDEEARLDGGAAGEVQAEQVVTLLLKKKQGKYVFSSSMNMKMQKGKRGTCKRAV